VNREAILSALELCNGLCCDSAEDREALASAIIAALRRQHDALLIRCFFAASPTDGTRLIAFAERRGNEQSEIIEAAWRLAGGGQ
jgi:predicted metal-dependent hydrolase